MPRVQGTILQTPDSSRLQVLEDHVVDVDHAGTIVDVSPAGDVDADVVLTSDTVLLPGLIDTHLHAPQWPQLGTGLDLPLERWLFEYTFPLEARYADISFARSVWDSMVPALLAQGTTTAVYYGSTHEPATLALAEACIEHGQRAFVGRVAMDHPDGTPEWYRDANAVAAVEDSARSIEAIAALPDPHRLVSPIVTPRFIPACTDAALEGLAELARATGTLVQTHCSESNWEHAYVFDRHGCSDTESLNRFGLIQDHTVLAHAVHISDADRRLLRETGAGVAHCPLSNSYFANGVFPARRHLDADLRVGLGSDIAGGAASSMLSQCQHAVTSSRMLDDGVKGDGQPDSRIDVRAAFWMATTGGAELLGIPVGLLEPGRLFDAFAVKVPDAVADDGGDWGRLFEKIVRLSHANDVETIWVNGVDVTPRRFSS